MNKEKKYYLTITVLICLVAVATIAISAVGYLFLSQKQAAIAEKRYYIDKSSQKVQILTELDQRYKKIEPDIPLIDNALPSEKDTSNLLADINTQATGAGLKLTFLRPDSSSSTSAKKSTSQTAGDLSLLQTVKGTISYELPLVLKVSGSYTNFLSFIGNIENYQRLINIKSIEIDKKDDEGVGDYIEATLNVKAYLKK